MQREQLCFLHFRHDKLLREPLPQPKLLHHLYPHGRPLLLMGEQHGRVPQPHPLHARMQRKHERAVQRPHVLCRRKQHLRLGQRSRRNPEVTIFNIEYPAIVFESISVTQFARSTIQPEVVEDRDAHFYLIYSTTCLGSVCENF
jgi:hypothetical protein